MSYIDPSQTPPLYDVFQNFKSEIFASLRVCLPATITAVHTLNGAANTVDVIPAILQTRPQVGNVNGQSYPYPEMLGCPIVTIQGGGAAAVFPVKVGDMCLVFFADRSMDAWKINGTPVALKTFRMHDLSDGFALVGINVVSKALKTPIADGEGGICETLTPIGIKVAINPLTNMATISNGPLPVNSLSGILTIMLTAMGSATTVPQIAAAATAANASLAALLY